ncbi:hypothetical protein [Petrimonas sulfuriphila]|uniref:hypothetical protein n=1 Tax=Petrimonas sulfuriphila TaxID=285070 RepID=UPI003EC09F6A
MSFEDKKYFKPVFITAKELLVAQAESNLVDILNTSDITVMQTGYDNWNGGINYYTLYIDMNVPDYVKNQPQIEAIEQKILDAFNTATRYTESEVFSQILISPKSTTKIDWSLLGNISKQDLLRDIEYLKNVMVSVATGGQRIQDIDAEYQKTYNRVAIALKKVDIENPNSYRSLWDWYGKWKSDFSRYQERRDYIKVMYEPVLSLFLDTEDEKLVDVKINLTGWERIKRGIIEINKREKQAENEEQFQAVGMLCRELIISLAQVVFNSELHPSLDGVEISKTDAKRMLESYIAIALAGGDKEELRSYAKITNKLANTLTHKRTATKKEMMLCTSATFALVNFIGVLEDKF